MTFGFLLSVIRYPVRSRCTNSFTDYPNTELTRDSISIKWHTTSIIWDDC